MQQAGDVTAPRLPARPRRIYSVRRHRKYIETLATSIVTRVAEWRGGWAGRGGMRVRVCQNPGVCVLRVPKKPPLRAPGHTGAAFLAHITRIRGLLRTGRSEAPHGQKDRLTPGQPQPCRSRARGRGQRRASGPPRDRARARWRGCAPRARPRTSPPQPQGGAGR